MLDNSGTRQLASLTTIEHIHPIPGADAIECGVIRNWPVVIGKGEFVNGDQVIYVEPDAALPLDDPRFAFLAPRGTKTIDEQKYHVLKTVRLRGQLSQGIVFAVEKFKRELDAVRDEVSPSLDAALGIRLYEPPMPALGAEQIGPWNLSWLMKTDAERVQNLSDEWLQSVDDGLWRPTEKIDGTSITYALDAAGELHIYSRNWELRTDNPAATPVELASRYGVRQWMADQGIDAIQGEMYGDFIQSNTLKIHGHRLAAFAAWKNQDGYQRDRFQTLLECPGALETAPVLSDGIAFPRTVEQALAQADGLKSLINPSQLAEGIVWHHLGDANIPGLDGRLVFKAVSSAYLLKHGL